MVLQGGTDEYKVSKKGNLNGRAAVAGTSAIFGKMPLRECRWCRYSDHPVLCTGKFPVVI